MFLAVTLEPKLSRFQTKPILSKNTRLPFLGALGRISWAGQVASSFLQANSVAAATANVTIAVPTKAYLARNGSNMSGVVNIIE